MPETTVNIHVSVDLLMGETNVATGNKWFFQLVSDRTNVAVRREDLRETRDEPLQPKAIFGVGPAVDQTKIKMGAGEDVGPTPSQTEEMRNRLRSHIAENGGGE